MVSFSLKRDKVTYNRSVLEHIQEQLKREGVVTLTVHVRTNAPSSECVGVLDDGTVKISLHAVPEQGKANEELRRFLAELFAVPLHQVELLSGYTSRRKAVRITGVSS